MTFAWTRLLQGMFEAPAEPRGRRLLPIGRFDLGVCAGCRSLRSVASPACSRCGSRVPVVPDA